MRLAHLIVFLSGAALAQGYSPPSSSVRVTGEVTVPNRVDTSPQSAPGTAVFVTGVDGAKVDTDPGPITLAGTPTVALSAASLASISAASAERICTYGTPVIDPALAAVSTAIPTTPFTGRTEIFLLNEDPVKEVWCRVGGTPSSTEALILNPDSPLTLLVRDNVALNCMCATGTCRFNFMEAACTQPSP